ncbi:SPW repeat protein [Streptomyces sp. NA04227]|uniref:SPW repeat protein n=1 Tax=Streptomyces sp. NA04227 TaxID=2742136 RepID=UPI0015906E31|nr:SPW repeat protein [Streptomyces sp. NA04227]QKW09071.1 SPW repeat protein [Streptomyces sp. NA04227]
MAASTSPDIHEHPDIVALRARSEAAAAAPASQAAEALSLLAGLFLAASPWIVGFNDLNALAINNLIAGLAFAFVSMGMGNAYERTHSMSWAALGIGAWTIIAPWVVTGDVSTTRTVVCNVIVGGCMCLFAMITAGLALGGGGRRR